MFKKLFFIRLWIFVLGVAVFGVMGILGAGEVRAHTASIDQITITCSTNEVFIGGQEILNFCTVETFDNGSPETINQLNQINIAIYNQFVNIPGEVMFGSVDNTDSFPASTLQINYTPPTIAPSADFAGYNGEIPVDVPIKVKIPAADNLLSNIITFSLNTFSLKNDLTIAPSSFVATIPDPTVPNPIPTNLNSITVTFDFPTIGIPIPKDSTFALDLGIEGLELKVVTVDYVEFSNAAFQMDASKSTLSKILFFVKEGEQLSTDDSYTITIKAQALSTASFSSEANTANITLSAWPSSDTSGSVPEDRTATASLTIITAPTLEIVDVIPDLWGANQKIERLSKLPFRIKFKVSDMIVKANSVFKINLGTLSLVAGIQDTYIKLFDGEGNEQNLSIENKTGNSLEFKVTDAQDAAQDLSTGNWMIEIIEDLAGDGYVETGEQGATTISMQIDDDPIGDEARISFRVVPTTPQAPAIIKEDGIKVNPSTVKTAEGAEHTFLSLSTLDTDWKEFNLYVHANRDCPTGGGGSEVKQYLEGLIVKGYFKVIHDGTTYLEVEDNAGGPEHFSLSLDDESSDNDFFVGTFIPENLDLPPRCQISVPSSLVKIKSTEIATPANPALLHLPNLIIQVKQNETLQEQETFYIEVFEPGALASVDISSDKTELPADGSDTATFIVTTKDVNNNNYNVINPATSIIFQEALGTAPIIGTTALSNSTSGRYEFTYTPPTKNEWQELSYIKAHIGQVVSDNSINIKLIQKGTSLVRDFNISAPNSIVKGQSFIVTITTTDVGFPPRPIILDDPQDLVVQLADRGVAGIFMTNTAYAASLGNCDPVTVTTGLGIYRTSCRAPNNTGNYNIIAQVGSYIEEVPIIISTSVTPPILAVPEPGSGLLIGDACYRKSDCSDTGPSGILTCDTELYYCVGQQNAHCGDLEVNTDKFPARTLRCEYPLVCSPTREGDWSQARCAQYFGADVVEDLELGEASRDIRDTARTVINIFLSFLGIIGVVIVIYGGVLWMTARGDDQQVEKARKTLVAGVIGIVIVAIAWTITSYVLKIGQTVGG